MHSKATRCVRACRITHIVIQASELDFLTDKDARQGGRGKYENWCIKIDGCIKAKNVSCRQKIYSQGNYGHALQMTFLNVVTCSSIN